MEFLVIFKLIKSLIFISICICFGYIGYQYFFPAKQSYRAPEISLKKSESAVPLLSESPLQWDWAKINADDVNFPKDFLWGVAGSAHQMEGNCTNSDWAAWEKDQNISQTGIACDHWNRYKEDIQLIKKLGVKAFRFSVEWSKIEPEEGTFDQAALDHYKEVCKELIAQGIKPVITLHHYTNPQWFAQKGAFEKMENISYFVKFAQKVFENLGEYVHLWITFNSPTSYCARAYHKYLAPPGKDNMQLMEEVLKNILESHVQVYQALKALPGGKNAKIGILHNIYQIEPATAWDQVGASMARQLFDESVYNFFTKGIFNVSIPFKVSVTHKNKKAPQSLDFIGLNYYSHGLMKNFNVTRCPHEIPTLNEMYTIYPEGLYRAIIDISEHLARPLKIPLYVTENGIATDNEEHRALFFQQYLFALCQAVKDGYDVRGYFVWSLMDNYEWGSYDKPYGIYSVNFQTQERSKQPKEGAHYFVHVVNKFSRSFSKESQG